MPGPVQHKDDQIPYRLLLRAGHQGYGPGCRRAHALGDQGASHFGIATFMYKLTGPGGELYSRLFY